MTIKERLKEPTPKFFKKVRNIGLALAAISTAIITDPVRQAYSRGACFISLNFTIPPYNCVTPVSDE